MKPFADLRLHPWRFVILTSLICAFLSGLAASALGPRYEVSLSYTINQRPRQSTVDYSYDGYYALQASQLFGDTLISWFATPSFIAEIYQRSGKTLSDSDAVKAAARFRAKKLSSQNVLVRFVVPDEKTAADLSDAAAKAVEEKTSELNKDAKGDSLFVIIPSKPVIAVRTVTPDKAALIGLLAGAALAAVGLYLASPPKA